MHFWDIIFLLSGLWFIIGSIVQFSTTNKVKNQLSANDVQWLNIYAYTNMALGAALALYGGVNLYNVYKSH